MIPSHLEISNCNMRTLKVIARLSPKGTYISGGKRRKVDGDISKLHLAADLSSAQKKLLANMHFRCAQVGGTQEIRRKIGHIGTWAAVQYGLGIFMTVSPGDFPLT